MVMSTYLLLVLLPRAIVVKSDYAVTIYPEVLKMGDVTHFDHDRWNGKNGLDSTDRLPFVKATGAVAARWLNRDLGGGLFEKAPENPQRKGYPDPSYFLYHQKHIADSYLNTIKGYGYPEVVMEIKGVYWPHWIDRSLHNGRFPNNIDAAAEFVYLMIQAVDKGSNGKPPLFFEVINEPDGEWKNTNWTTYVTFHQAVADKIKSKYPNIKVGGPTYTGASIYYDRYNFRIWKTIEQFLDMALHHLDFFSFHSYTFMDVKGGTHQFYHNSEAKLVGLLDLIESYAYNKRGNAMDIVISEFGLGRVSGIDVNKPSSFLDWAYIYQHNAQLFTYLEHRDIMRKAVAFLLSYTELLGQASINYSILDKNNHERDIAQAFRFWKNMNNTMTYLRVDSQFHGAERKIVPHALVDITTGSLLVLLHNHGKKPTHVKLNFAKGWFHPSSGKSTCEYLSSQMKPVLDVEKPVHITNAGVTVPAETSCYFQFHTTHNFAHVPTVTQTTYYSNHMVIPIQNTVDVMINILTLHNMEFARLRIGVSVTDKSTDPKPKKIQINNHSLTSFYSLHSQNAPSDPTMWQSYEYYVPVSILTQHNDVKVTFQQTGGYLSTVALLVGHH